MNGMRVGVLLLIGTPTVHLGVEWVLIGCHGSHFLGVAHVCFDHSMGDVG